MNVIEIKELTKSFEDQRVLDNVSLNFEEGKIYGLVGRNGSGKSVLLKCIAGLVVPEKGTIKVLGKQLGEDTDFAPSTGIAIEQPGLLLRYNARKNLRILAEMSSTGVSNEQIDILLKTVGLIPNEKKAVQKYSMGMKQKLSIALAILCNPQILLLDEPMSNLDEESAGHMRTLFRKLADGGKTILIATHVKEDVEGLCESIYKCGNGNVVKQE